MNDYTLFFGISVTDKLALSLQSMDEQILSIFINQNDPAYLQEISYNGMRYIGKMVGKTIDLAGLDLLQANIYSLLSRILPEYPSQECPLMLFSTPISHQK